MEYLLKRKIKGNRHTLVNEHLSRAKRIADVIWVRFQVGPYQYQLKHLRWYINVYYKDLAPNTRYRHWLTIRHIVRALNKSKEWSVLFEKSRWGF